MTADDIVKILGLVPLAEEGGLFRETYRSRETLPSGRSLSTAIYYLLAPDRFSAIHRVRGDEVFHFYLGDPVEMLQLHPGGIGEMIVLGSDLTAGMHPQVIVPGGVWQGSRLKTGGRFALLGTTMSPGFDAKDFELATRSALLEEYPTFEKEILRLTHGGSGT